MTVMELSEARDRLREQVDDGATCPCCGQFAKVYRRKINSGMARSLIRLYQLDTLRPAEWVHLPTQVGSRSREEGKLAYWGLVENSGVLRNDDGPSGFWRITEAGIEFVLLQRSVPQYARVYNGRCLGLEGKYVSIVDALGTRFDYRELMEGL